jgi:hypothetical protein
MNDSPPQLKAPYRRAPAASRNRRSREGGAAQVVPASRLAHEAADDTIRIATSGIKLRGLLYRMTEQKQKPRPHAY